MVGWVGVASVWDAVGGVVGGVVLASGWCNQESNTKSSQPSRKKFCLFF